MLTCGRKMTGTQVAVTVGDGVAHYAGVRSCGAVWTCGVCAPKIRQRRAEEVGLALADAEAQGYGLAFLTLTVAHHVDDTLERVYSLQEAAWKALQQSRAWRDCMAELGVIGHIVFREVTYGLDNGWHPHRHVVLVLKEPVGAARLESWQPSAWQAWQHQLSKRGLTSSERHGLDVRAVTRGTGGGIGWYVAKVAQEMTRGDLKRARGDRHFTPEQLLDLLDETGEAWAADRWVEYALATGGRRMLTWSHGLRKRLSLAREATDEELAEEEVGGEVVALLDRSAWAAVLSTGRSVDVLEAAEDSMWDLAVVLSGIAPASSWQLLKPVSS